MPRRTWTYDANMGWNEANFVSTCGAYLLGVGLFTYLGILIWSYFKGKPAGNDPWDGRIERVRRLAGLPARRLTPPHDLLRRQGFQLAGHREFEWGLVRADVWRRSGG